MNVAREITDRLTMREVFVQYGFSPDKKGNICCPFHREKDPSLGYYSDGKRWHCFGCNEGGSVIDFVMKFFGLDFRQAITKLDYDFNLGLSGRRLSSVERERIRRQELERKRREEAERQAKEEKNNAYNNALDLWVENEKITRRYKGTSKCAFDYPREYWTALIHRQYAAYLLDSIER